MKKVILLHSFLLSAAFLFGLAAYFCLPEEQILALQQYLTVQMQDFSTTATLTETSRPRVSRQCYGFCAHLSSRDLSAGCAVNSAIFIFKRLFLWFCSLLSVGPFALAAVISFALFPIVDCRCGSRCPF